MRSIKIFFIFIASLLFCSWTMLSTESAPEDGKEIYMTYCKSCHGKKGNLGIGGAAKLNKSEMPVDERITIITDGKGKMAPFGSILSKKEVRAVAEFTMAYGND